MSVNDPEELEPDETPRAEEYEPAGGEAVSDDTGTVYEAAGEPATTTHDDAEAVEAEDAAE